MSRSNRSPRRKNALRQRSVRAWPARDRHSAKNLRGFRTEPLKRCWERHMKPEEEDWDEARYSSLLRSTDHEMPPPDPDFLARLRERSTQAFLEAAAQEIGRASCRERV